MTKQVAPAPEPTVGKRRIMDFAPVSRPVIHSVSQPKKNPQTPISHPRPDIAMPRRAPRQPASVVTVSDNDLAPKESRIDRSAKINMPKNLFIGDIKRPIKRPPVQASHSIRREDPIVVDSIDDLPLEEPVFEGPVAKSTVIDNEKLRRVDDRIPDEELSEGSLEEPLGELTEELPEESEKLEEDSLNEVQAEVPTTKDIPRRRGVRIDFMRRVSSAISSVRKSDQLGTTTIANVEDTIVETKDDITPEDNFPADMIEEDYTSNESLAATGPLDSEDLTVADALDAMTTTDNEENKIAENDELAEVLAGFASASVNSPELADNLSSAVQDFEEEIDALEESEVIPDELLETSGAENTEKDTTVEQIKREKTEHFISEPTTLFASSGADPLVEQSLHRKKPEFKEPTTYIDGSSVRSVNVEKKKPEVEPYRKILGARSPFLNSVSVEKRPLSNSVAKEKASSTIQTSSTIISIPEKTPTRSASVRATSKVVQTLEKIAPIESNTETKQETISVPEVDGKVNKFPLALAVLLTLILGGIAGAFIYLVFLQ